MKLYDLFYWNKHEYCWKWIGMAEGKSKHDVIRMAKQYWLIDSMMKVEEYHG